MPPVITDFVLGDRPYPFAETVAVTIVSKVLDLTNDGHEYLGRGICRILRRHSRPQRPAINAIAVRVNELAPTAIVERFRPAEQRTRRATSIYADNNARTCRELKVASLFVGALAFVTHRACRTESGTRSP